ncbi:F-box protein CPR1-like [Lycium barbarum]|uniref:F-box protein CPR1-like n=1 Tax=Lycium barbarum TaxID=112863 RepID=UPI00293F74C0|nr:F-box protein CPR1-like [Lycium barbarum]
MKHHIHAKDDQNSQKILICQCCRGKDDMFNFYSSHILLIRLVEDQQKLDCPSNCKPLAVEIFCCCDGLVLFQVSNRLDRHLLLWNPSTRESILVPHPESALDDCVCGLGYEATSDDYKILTINLNASFCDNVWIEILVLKSGSWRRIGKYPTGVHRVRGFRDCGTDDLPFVHGAFHWLGMLRYPTIISQYHTIISFNISNEVYGEIPLLERMLNRFRMQFIEHGVSVLRGMLCFYSTYSDTWEGTFKLWVMKDYGIKESWTKLITIQEANLFHSARPKHMFADGEVLMCCKSSGRLSSVFRTSGGPFGFWPQRTTAKQGIVYTESLISPKLLS